MKRRDIVRRAGRSLKQSKVRTLLTSFAIAVGAFTLTVSLAAGEGSRQYADKLVGSNVNPRALFIVKDNAFFDGAPGQSGLREYDPDAVTTQGGVTIKQLTQADLDKLSAREDIEDVQPIYQLSIDYLTIEGSDKKFIADVSRYDSSIRNESAAGELPPLGTDISDDSIVMPESFAKTLVEMGAATSVNDVVGKKITLTISKPATEPTKAEIERALATGGVSALAELTRGETKEESFVVSAITQQSSTALTASTAMQLSSNQTKATADYTTEGTSQYQKYTSATALVKEDREPAEVKEALNEAGYPTQTAKDLQNLLFTIVNVLQGIVAGFGVLALIASVFGIINTQYISVLERTQQIGLMKALGMRSKDVAKLFRYEAAWIGFLGGVIGAVFAWAVGTTLNPWISEQLSLGDGNYLLVFQPLPIILLIVSLMIIAVVAGFFPARKAAKLDPIEALRTE
jgi:putative ABC transport system permease protein